MHVWLVPIYTYYLCTFTLFSLDELNSGIKLNNRSNLLTSKLQRPCIDGYFRNFLQSDDEKRTQLICKESEK